ncbi:MAG: Gfo/Idh/MocA family oxidoreductase [Bacteroidales bacterium]|nr:Gfo/Idh/MocA family oxidoreductase [Bacteroidales bacterium]
MENDGFFSRESIPFEYFVGVLLMSYGFGIIGLGLIADFHARAIKEMRNGELVASFSRDKKKASIFAEKYHCQAYDSLEKFLSHPGLDIVNICTPSGAHLEPATMASEAGKHLIIEKPLEITLQRCDEIIRVCEKNKVKCSGIFQSRFFPLSRIIKNAIQQGRFGQLVLCDAYVKWQRSQDYYDDGGWHGTLLLDGGGALMNQSIHAIDLLHYFAGDVIEISACIDTIGHQRIEVEDNAVAILKFKNGALGIIEGSTSVYPGFLKRIEISGTDGSIIMEEEALKTWDFKKEKEEDKKMILQFMSLKNTSGGGVSDPGAISYQGHKIQFEDMVEAIGQDRKPYIDGYEARKAVEIVLAIYQSAREKKAVQLPISY